MDSSISREDWFIGCALNAILQNPTFNDRGLDEIIEVARTIGLELCNK